MQKQSSILLVTAMLAVGCAAALPPHHVESRNNATKPWRTYAAITVARIPGFTPKAGREAEYFKTVKKGGSSYGFPFVFHPEFEKTAERVIAKVAKYADDPYLIGYFIDNEVQFKRTMLLQCLTAWPKDHPNRRAAQAWLDARKGRTGCAMRDVTKEDSLDFVRHSPTPIMI